MLNARLDDALAAKPLLARKIRSNCSSKVWGLNWGAFSRIGTKTLSQSAVREQLGNASA